MEFFLTFVDVVIKHEKLSDLEMIVEMGFNKGFTIAMEGLDKFLNQKKVSLVCN
jgi:hypothetical protein